jgi:hypothetical protein
VPDDCFVFAHNYFFFSAFICVFYRAASSSFFFFVIRAWSICPRFTAAYRLIV